MDVRLTEDDAATLRHLASVPALEARRYLQDHPEVARRVGSWPPEIRLEICRIIYRSFDEPQQERLHRRVRPSSDLLELIVADPPTPPR